MWEPFEITPGVEDALHRLAAAVERAGASSCYAGVRGGSVRFASLVDRRGTQHHLNIIDGEWFELVTVDG